MALKIELLNEAGELVSESVSAAVVDLARALPDDPNRYFLYERTAFMVDVALLVQTRIRPEGVRNACHLMAKAYAGECERRKSIEIQEWVSGKYLVIDGNSTVTVAKAAGWKFLPCTTIAMQ